METLKGVVKRDPLKRMDGVAKRHPITARRVLIIEDPLFVGIVAMSAMVERGTHLLRTLTPTAMIERRQRVHTSMYPLDGRQLWSL